jgi:hypothetical protein
MMNDLEAGAAVESGPADAAFRGMSAGLEESLAPHRITFAGPSELYVCS